MGPKLQEIVRTFDGRNPLVFRIPKGVHLPDDLCILHEHTDHYSLQCTKPMSLQGLFLYIYI